MQIELLDMGQTKFGDCILITHGTRRILIDGAHPRDEESIRKQLSELLNQNPPFNIHLLVVTHCHSDHIGCLPALVNSGDLIPEVALVADERLGFGRDGTGRGPGDDDSLTNPQKTLLLALQEEEHSSLSDSELVSFLQDVVNLETAYKEMLTSFKDNGVNVIRYGRDNDAKLRQLEEDFSDFGLQILGPTQEHLLLCAERIADSNVKDDSDFADLGSDAKWDQIAKVYKSIALDRPGIGAAKNDQSIILKVSADGWSALLAGDMQFAKAEVAGLGSMMQALLDSVNEAGPYDFIKLTHHTSYNGMDEEILDTWLENTRLFAHTGGSRDATHPEKGVLQVLKNRSRFLRFARTDRNGIITIKKENGEVTLMPEKGRLNDFTPNQLPDEEGATTASGILQKVKTGLPVEAPAPSEVVLEQASQTDGIVEVTAKIPHVSTKVTITVEVDTKKKSNTQIIPNTANKTVINVPDSSKRFNRILFITCSPLLATNIGILETQQILDGIKKTAENYFWDLTPFEKAEDASVLVREKLKSLNPRGVVIIGGYDVIPAQQLDAIDRALRQKVASGSFDGFDADDFIVWSDDIYGDVDGDTVAEYPVSRVPDGRMAQLIIEAFQAPPFQKSSRFGVRNMARPFANDVFQNIPGKSKEINVSEKFAPSNVEADSAQGAVYYMLHGSFRDGTRFWGETSGGDTCEAFLVDNVPKSAKGTIVFTGCCWGALIVQPPAFRKTPDVQLRPRTVEQSIALSYLKAGAVAFIGCTGSHYSPVSPPFDYFGQPMHKHFWDGIIAGKNPAQALYEAKKQYAKELPHGQTDPFTQAIEMKILRQYTCLGIGW